MQKDIAVMEFSEKHFMYQLESPDDIFHKMYFSYVTEACVATMQGAQHTGEVWSVYFK